MRTGAEYLKSLDDGRTVILDGAAVGNVAEHPAFAPMAKTIAELLDIANDESNDMQYTAPETCATANRVPAMVSLSPQQIKSGCASSSPMIPERRNSWSSTTRPGRSSS